MDLKLHLKTVYSEYKKELFFITNIQMYILVFAS